MKVRADPIKYVDEGGWRNVDLRVDGVDCVPLFGTASIHAISPGAEMHVHPGCIEFCLCVKGNLRYATTDGEYRVLPGQIFVSQPEQPHRRCNNPKGMRLYQILFRLPAKGESVLGLTERETSFLVGALRRFPYRLCPSPPRVVELFRRLCDLQTSEKRGTLVRKLKMRSAALELFLALAEAPYMSPTEKGLPNAKLKAIVDRMNDHPELDFPIERISAEAALSSGAFTDAFKRTTGLTPHAYLIDVRVRKARADLEKGNEPVAVVAKRYRFPTARHFATVFKRIIGMSPRQCRPSSYNP
ncbi:MAG: AraC family transcriptional regulator [Verrucomicrobiota bacterium]|nr:AraC family transcriptional regulator [Verrucomicrobiota bacterium]